MRIIPNIFILLSVILLAGCSKTVYVPVQSTRTEYTDRMLRDSVHLYDSVFVKEKGDTVRIEKYKYLYKDKIIRDSILKIDSIQVLCPVDKYVNRLTGWQNFQIWLGRITLAIIGMSVVVLIIRAKLK